MQDDDGQILEAHSISAGLDYPGAGPSTPGCATRRARYEAVTDDEAVAAFQRDGGSRASSRRSRRRTRWPGCSHRPGGELDLICLSGRGDKDLAEVLGAGLTATAWTGVERIAGAFAARGKRRR